jgi:hypothetical protein
MMDDGSHRFQAARWVIRLGRLLWGLLVLVAAWSLLAGVLTGSPAALVVPLFLAGWATVWGALIRAFTVHRRGARELLVGVAAIGALWPAVGWLAVRPPTVGSVVSAALHGVLLGLLLHRDSREWVGTDERQRPFAEQSGGLPIGGH